MADYIDNAKFYEAIVERKILLKQAEEQGLAKPQISNYLGECIVLIATKLASKGNFNGYSYKDEMISDGIENCIVYFDKFDSENYKNPFAYFTQIIYFAYLRRIGKEKQQFLLKHKIIQSVGNKVMDLQDHDDDSEFINSYREFLQEFSNVEQPEIVKKDKPVKEKVQTTSTLDLLYGELA
jgi:hypothetical protein